MGKQIPSPQQTDTQAIQINVLLTSIGKQTFEPAKRYSQA